MTEPKSPRSKKKISDVFALRAIGDGDPNVYTPEEREIIFRFGLQYGRGLLKAREAANFSEQAEAFLRKTEIAQIFRELPEHLRKRPSGQKTKDAVLSRLKKIGITSSERTLMRDYEALGGAKVLRSAKPFAPGEDRSSPLQAHHRQKPNKPKS
jgi:hypothetical protein